jgi:hypothetical protein
MIDDLVTKLLAFLSLILSIVGIAEGLLVIDGIVGRIVGSVFGLLSVWFIWWNIYIWRS